VPAANARMMLWAGKRPAATQDHVQAGGFEGFAKIHRHRAWHRPENRKKGGIDSSSIRRQQGTVPKGSICRFLSGLKLTRPRCQAVGRPEPIGATKRPWGAS